MVVGITIEPSEGILPSRIAISASIFQGVCAIFV
jgi:hypothetical protein